MQCLICQLPKLASECGLVPLNQPWITLVAVLFSSLYTIAVGQKKSVMAAHLEELEDPEKEAREETKIISQQEYVTRLRELNNEIAHAWLNNERVSALRLSIKVVRPSSLWKEFCSSQAESTHVSSVLSHTGAN